MEKFLRDTYILNADEMKENLNMEKKYNWTDEQPKLWKAWVPKSGQAKTLQGEVIRLTGKLTDEAFRNGNLNWTKSHANAWRFVASTISASTQISEADRREIDDDANWIISNYRTLPIEAWGSPYYFLTEKAVDFCWLTQIPLILNPTRRTMIFSWI